MTAATKKAKPPTKTEIASGLAKKIDVHLQRFEKDKKINWNRRWDKAAGGWVPDPRGVSPYYGAHAVGNRHRVWVVYITYQSGSFISIEDAERYLAWLDDGNEGRHYEALREARK